MDERIFYPKKGKPVPSWDMQHRLSINGKVGPTTTDNGTIFRVNSTFMDITDQPHMIRQWLAGGTLTAGIMFTLFFYSIFLVSFIYPPKNWESIDTATLVLIISASIFFGATTVFFGHHEFFSLKRRPIRFNRLTQKIYAIRHRRWLERDVRGDLSWEISWDSSTIFCVHKGPAKFDLGNHYHIRCYQLDDAGNVLRAFAMGKDWQGTSGLRDLLAQWNYWCLYMNKGPSKLPKPMLYLAEREDIIETFFYCLYEIGFNLPGLIRIILIPFILVLTALRLISLLTCSTPKWASEVLEVSQISENDQFHQPSGATPIGWAATVRAHREGSYPEGSMCITENWTGEQDPLKNAMLWRNDLPPHQYCEEANREASAFRQKEAL
ncbi:hypothetical protein HSX11_13670 [Oxalobacteraceae bacterium]|nr:hypothetical protein [Oxalobacteraceae bacterium]